MTCPQSPDRQSPDNPQPPLSRAVRFAISAGPLIAARLAIREHEAREQGRHLLEVLTEAEQLHLQFIQRTMPRPSTWEEALDAIRQSGRGGA